MKRRKYPASRTESIRPEPGNPNGPLGATATGVLLLLCTALLQPASAQSIEALGQLSIEDLGKVEITSVSKRPEELRTAAAAVYVITHDDIIRSGATSIPEILRLAPNLFVVQTSPSHYVVTARGFSGNEAYQSYSNKLLVLVDGRSVYSPLYSGVYWDTVDVLPEDIERIEVISGPGATLWGANAENGVINIITRKSSDTQGGLLDIGIGNLEESAALQYGGSLDDDLDYRVYGKAFFDHSDATPSGTPAHDGWYKPQGGFRLDWSPASDVLTVQGDMYGGREDQTGAPDAIVEGRNLEATWQHDVGSGSSLQILGYYDQSRRATEDNKGSFTISTYDLEAQENFALGSWNSIVWGAGERVDVYSITDDIGPLTSLLFVPTDRTLNLADGFVQDRVSLADQLDVILGLKMEDDPWSGWSVLPTARVSWQLNSSTMLWAAASRAIRAPTPFDTDVVEKFGANPFLIGNPDFLPEKLTAYEVGYRGQLADSVSLSVSGYDNDYSDLKDIELNPLTDSSLEWGNTMHGHVYGAEAWGNWQATDWWRLSAGLNIQHEALRIAPGLLAYLGVDQAGDDPHHQASLRSSMNLPYDLTFDADLRYVGALPDPQVPEYFELNTRLGWMVTQRVEISLSGFNLLHPEHEEFPAPADEIKRSVFLDLRFKF